MSGDAIIAEDASVVLGTFQALKGVSFRLPENAYLAILGPNGAGKTTLVRALMGLERLSGGCLQLFGGEPSAIDPSQVGYVPQLKTLDRRFPALPIELVVSGLRGSWPWRITGEERLRALNALRIAGMEDKAERPLGGLSGGEMQRVYLARAIVRHPRLVILDEPAAGMDVSGEADMYHVLEHYREDHEATVVMITHD